MYLSMYLARRSKLDPETFANAAILALVTGVLGAPPVARAGELTRLHAPNLTFWQNFFNAINIREGGLTYYGGFLLAFPSLVLYAKWKKVPLPVGMDIIAPCLMVGLAFGRIGCFMNGCCYGATCDASIGVRFPYGSDAYVTQFNENKLTMPVPRELIRDHDALGEYMDEQRPTLKEIQEPLPPLLAHQLLNDRSNESHVKGPEQIRKESWTAEETQFDSRQEVYRCGYGRPAARTNPVHAAEVYSSVAAFLIAAFLLAYFTLAHVPGRVFAAMMIIEGIFRYVLEMVPRGAGRDRAWSALSSVTSAAEFQHGHQLRAGDRRSRAVVCVRADRGKRREPRRKWRETRGCVMYSCTGILPVSKSLRSAEL